MRREGILQVLGSQALPVGVASQEVPHLPPSGNVLEMENWRPKKYDPILRTAVSVPHIAVYMLFTPLYMYLSLHALQTKRFTAVTPSNRQTTVEALGSLPAPEETAQVSGRHFMTVI